MTTSAGGSAERPTPSERVRTSCPEVAPTAHPPVLTDPNLVESSTTPLPVVIVIQDRSRQDSAALDLAERGLDVRTRSLDEGFRELAPDIDLLVVDIAQPFKANDVCRQIREVSDLPLILVTTAAEETHVVVGLELGADDYMVRPYRPEVLVARIRSVLRRVGQSKPLAAARSGVLVVGKIQLDADSHEVVVRGQRVAFPLKEFALLEILMLNAGRHLSRRLLLDRLWRPNYVDSTGTLDVHIARIRAKIEKDPTKPRLLLSTRGVGFMFDDRVRD